MLHGVDKTLKNREMRSKQQKYVVIGDMVETRTEECKECMM